MSLFKSVRAIISREAGNNTTEPEDVTSASTEDAPDPAEESGSELPCNIELPGLELSPSELTSSIESHYDVTTDQADELVELVLTGHEEGWKYDKTVQKAVGDGLDLPQEQIKTVVWNETTGIRLRRDAAQKRDSTVIDGVNWHLPSDQDVSPVCQATAQEIGTRGGSVSVDTLQEILQANAEQYEDGLPERAKHWVPHDRCQCMLIADT